MYTTTTEQQMAWIKTYISHKENAVMAVTTNNRGRWTVGTRVTTYKHNVSADVWIKKFGSKENVIAHIRKARKLNLDHWDVVRTEQVTASASPRARYNRIKEALKTKGLRNSIQGWQIQMLKDVSTRRPIGIGRWSSSVEGSGKRSMTISNLTMIDLYLTKIESNNQ